MQRERRVSIQEAAEVLGKSAWTLRRLEKSGVLPPVGRGHNGYRYYTESDIERMRHILYPPVQVSA